MPFFSAYLILLYYFSVSSKLRRGIEVFLRGHLKTSGKYNILEMPPDLGFSITELVSLLILPATGLNHETRLKEGEINK